MAPGGKRSGLGRPAQSGELSGEGHPGRPRCRPSRARDEKAGNVANASPCSRCRWAPLFFPQAHFASPRGLRPHSPPGREHCIIKCRAITRQIMARGLLIVSLDCPPSRTAMSCRLNTWDPPLSNRPIGPTRWLGWVGGLVPPTACTEPSSPWQADPFSAPGRDLVPYQTQHPSTPTHPLSRGPPRGPI